MPGKKRRKKTFSKVEAVKAMAREHLGAVPPAKVVPDKKRTVREKEKHRKTLHSLLDDSLTE